MPEKEEEKRRHSKNVNQALKHIRKGVQENEEKNFRKAINHLDNAISISPHDYLLQFYKGFAFYNLGEHEEAEECFSRSTSIKESAGVRFFEGSNKMKLGKLEEAKEILERSLELSPEQHPLREDIEEKCSEVEKRLEEEKESKKELDEGLEELEEESEEI